MKVSSNYRYSRDCRNLKGWAEYICIQTKIKCKGKIMERDEMNFDSIFTFGKYKGEVLEDVIESDPNYVAWLVENDIVPLAPEVMKRLAERKII